MRLEWQRSQQAVSLQFASLSEGFDQLIRVSASFSNANAHVAKDYLRFVACKGQEELELAKSRLRGLKAFL